MKHKKKREPGYQKERSERQHQRILDLLASGPMTCATLAELMFLSQKCVWAHIHTLQQKPDRRVRVVDYEVSSTNPARIYGLGRMPDFTLPNFYKRRILAAMDEPMTLNQIMGDLGLKYSTARRYLNQLRDDNKVHVAQWNWSDRTPEAMYAKGAGESVPKPNKRPEEFFIPRKKAPAIQQSWASALGL